PERPWLKRKRRHWANRRMSQQKLVLLLERSATVNPRQINRGAGDDRPATMVCTRGQMVDGIDRQFYRSAVLRVVKGTATASVVVLELCSLHSHALSRPR